MVYYFKMSFILKTIDILCIMLSVSYFYGIQINAYTEATMFCKLNQISSHTSKSIQNSNILTSNW